MRLGLGRASSKVGVEEHVCRTHIILSPIRTTVRDRDRDTVRVVEVRVHRVHRTRVIYLYLYLYLYPGIVLMKAAFT